MVQKLTLGEFCRSLEGSRKYELIVKDVFSPFRTKLYFDSVFAETGVCPTVMFFTESGGHLVLRNLRRAVRITLDGCEKAFRLYMADIKPSSQGAEIECIIKCY